MFGKNQVAGPRTDIESPSFLVHSIFYTIQGEGPHAGLPAIFVRLAGCNLRCFFCDTEFEQGATEMSLPELEEAIGKLVDIHECSLVVLTGGEPMLQPIGLLIASVVNWSRGWMEWQIETAGTVWPSGDFPTAGEGNIDIVVSPKTGKVHRNLVSREEPALRVWWKYILRAEDALNESNGLPRSSTQAKGVEMPLFVPVGENRKRVFVQACDEHDPAKNVANLQRVADISLRFGYRVSVQMHKLLHVE